jgi:hypothetical protein
LRITHFHHDGLNKKQKGIIKTLRTYTPIEQRKTAHASALVLFCQIFSIRVFFILTRACIRKGHISNLGWLLHFLGSSRELNHMVLSEALFSSISSNLFVCKHF